jgi:hypothetical protein
MAIRLDARAWREDLDYLAGTLLDNHPNPFHRISRQEFEEAADNLRSRVPELEGDQVIVEFAHLLAMIRDGHSGFHLDETKGYRRYPLRLYVFSDGLFVQAAGADLARAAGARVVSIGNATAQEAYEEVRRVVNYDNELGMKSSAPSLLVIPEVLHTLGLVDDPEHGNWRLQTTDGGTLEIDLRPVEDGSSLVWVDASENAQAPVPLYLRAPDDNYWFEYLAERSTLYVQFNSIRDKKDETIAQFYERVFAFVEQNPVERMVLDIRLNGGGNNTLNQPLVHGLIRCDKVNRPGRLFTIIGRRTFSAAMNLTNDLEAHTRTLFVGEPTGSSPNHYGDAERHTLPNSGLDFWVSTLSWQYSFPTDTRPWVAPDLPVELSSEDYRTRLDPCLEAILNVAPGTLDVEPFPDRIFGAIARSAKSV